MLPTKVCESFVLEKFSVVGIRAFFNISSAWNLKFDEEITLLGFPDTASFDSWKRDPSTANLSRDTLERISCILGIYKALQILLPDSKAADEWIKKPNSEVIFSGKPALYRMLSGDVADLLIVRQYLDAMCCPS